MPIECEVCGNPIHGAPLSVHIDGSLLRVCHSCARLGKPANPPKPSMPKPASVSPKPSTRSLAEEGLEIRSDFNVVIKRMREKLGLSQEQVGRKMNEKISVIKLLESGKLRPDNILARKIEHLLKVEILVPPEPE